MANHTSVRRGASAQSPLPKLTGALTVGYVGAVAHGLPHLLAAPVVPAHHLVHGGQPAPIVSAVQSEYVGFGQSHPPIRLRRPLLAGEHAVLYPDVDERR